MFGDLHIQQPSLARPTVAQQRAMRAIEAGDMVAVFRADVRTMRSLFSNQWVTDGPALTAAGRAAMGRYA